MAESICSRGRLDEASRLKLPKRTNVAGVKESGMGVMTLPQSSDVSLLVVGGIPGVLP